MTKVEKREKITKGKWMHREERRRKSKEGKIRDRVAVHCNKDTVAGSY